MINIAITSGTSTRAFESVEAMLCWLQNRGYIDWYELSSEGFACENCRHRAHQNDMPCEQGIFFGKRTGSVCGCQDYKPVELMETEQRPPK